MWPYEDITLVGSETYRDTPSVERHTVNIRSTASTLPSPQSTGTDIISHTLPGLWVFTKSKPLTKRKRSRKKNFQRDIWHDGICSGGTLKDWPFCASLNEWVLITTWKKSVWSTRIGRITPIWNPLTNCRVSIEGKSGLMRWGTMCRNIESPQCCHAPGPSVLGSSDPRCTETFARQASTSRVPTPRTHTSNSVQKCTPSPTTTLQ
jgi:hypothetical protein